MIYELCAGSVLQYEQYLTEHEKSAATIQKYLREVNRFMEYFKTTELNKESLMACREQMQQNYQPQTVNGKLNAINSFLKFIGYGELKLNLLRIQHRSFMDENRELSHEDYCNLLSAAKMQGKDRLYHLMLTLGGTGIRISELKFITVEAVNAGEAIISLKGKNRVVLIGCKLQKKLMQYAKANGIDSGMIFRTRSGKPLDRSDICHEMKTVCEAAGVDPHRVFPHNFRHLFARAFYAVEKNLAHLADILGHSSIETTRIYLTSTAKDYEHTLCRMNLIL